MQVSRLLLAIAALLLAIGSAAGPTRLPAPDLSGFSFTPADGFASHGARVIGVEPDGRLLVAGTFSAVNGVPMPGLARVGPDNELDASWQPALPPGWRATLAALDPQGDWVIAGENPAGSGTYEIRRVDASSASAALVHAFPALRTPTAMTLDGEGHIYVASGECCSFAEEGHAYVHKISADGVRDPAFEVVLSGDLGCYVLWFTHPTAHALVHDGAHLYIGGSFTAASGAEPFGRPGLARVTVGAPAPSTPAAPAAKTTPGCIVLPVLPIVYAAARGGDGFLYVGAGDGFERISLLDGARKSLGDFGPRSHALAVSHVAIDTVRHRAYVAGSFQTINGIARPGLAAISTLPQHFVDPAWTPAAETPATLGLRLLADRLVHLRAVDDPAEMAAGYSLAGEDVMGRYYETILGRAPDPSGLGYWPGEIARLADLGVDPREAYIAMAMYFFGSPEFNATPLTDEQYLERLYLAFFGRAIDPSGHDYWLAALQAGLTREMVMFAFMFSPEFEAYMDAALGAAATRPEIDVVADFYRGALARLPDAEGLRHWVNQLRTAQCQPPEALGVALYAVAASISATFFNGTEYAGSGPTDADYVSDLYNAFMRRGADPAGFAFWVDGLSGGLLTRDQVRQAFLHTPEFGTRIAAMAAAGCIAPMP